MQAEAIRRFDYNQPPPGQEFYGMTLLVLGSADHGDGLQTLPSAWRRWKERYNPPGLELRQGPHGLGFVALGKDSPIFGAFDWPEQARAAAWAHYDRRLDLAKRLGVDERGIARAKAEGTRAPLVSVWPRILAWLDEQVAEVERWLTEGGALPEVLRAASV